MLLTKRDRSVAIMKPQDRVEEALRAAEIHEDGWRRKSLGLSEAELELYREILRMFPQLGGPPGPEILGPYAARLGLELGLTLGTLAELDLIVLDSTGAIVGAYPFSGAPTVHRVQIEGFQAVYAMCAVDALGIPSMLGTNATVTSVDLSSGDRVRVEVVGQSVRWKPSESVVFICRPGHRKGAACCTVINFFGSLGSLDAYRREHPDLEGFTLTIPEAVEAGRRVFGSVLSDASVPAWGACGEVGWMSTNESEERSCR